MDWLNKPWVYRLRCMPPILSMLVIVIVYHAVQNGEYQYDPVNSDGKWIGPNSACLEWERVLDGSAGMFVRSNMDTDSDGDIYFTDAQVINITSERYDLTFRLRKLSALGALVFDIPLYAQLNGPSRMHDAPRDVFSIQTNSMPRLFTAMESHDNSNTIVVIQQGDFNDTAEITRISALSLYDAVSGACLWGVSHTGEGMGGVERGGEETTGGERRGEEMAGEERGGQARRGEEMAGEGRGLQSCAVSLPPDATDLRLRSLAVSQVSYVDGPASLYSCPEYSYLSTLGIVAGRAQVDVWRIAFDNCAYAAPTLKAAWSSVLDNVAPGGWSQESSLPLVSTKLWDRCVGDCAEGGKQTIVIVVVPHTAVSPWMPFATNISMASMYAYNASNGVRLWSLQSLRGLDTTITAIISNVEVTPHGIAYVAVVRPLTLSNPNDIQYAIAVLAVDIASGTLLWESSVAPFEPGGIKFGAPVQLLQLHASASALLFCSLPPGMNMTASNNGTSDDEIFMYESSYGLGALDVDGGGLIWHDFVGGSVKPPEMPDWIPTQVSYCASDIISDDFAFFVTVARKDGLQDGGPVSGITESFAAYSRALITGVVEWSAPLSATAQANTYRDYFTATKYQTSEISAAGQVMARMEPIQYTAFASPSAGRLLVKVDPSVFYPIPVNDIQQRLETQQEYNNQAAQPLVSAPLYVLSFQCQRSVGTDLSWIYMFVALVASLLGVRLCLGTISATVSFRRYLHKNHMGLMHSLLGGDSAAASHGDNDALTLNIPKDGTALIDQAATSQQPAQSTSDLNDIGDDLDELCTIHISRAFRDALPPADGPASPRQRSNGASNFVKFFARPKRGTPWVLISIVHYIAMMILLTKALSNARIAITSLKGQLDDPGRFLVQYLINRSPVTGPGVCPSSVAAACYCTADSITNGCMGQASCSTSGQTCPFSLSFCAGSCSRALKETGNCGASVFEYNCACSSGDCTETAVLQNATFRTDGYGGLPGGLQACSAHYETIYFIMTISVVCYGVFSSLAISYLFSVWKSFFSCVRHSVAYCLGWWCPASRRWCPSCFPDRADPRHPNKLHRTHMPPYQNKGKRQSHALAPVVPSPSAGPVTASRLLLLAQSDPMDPTGSPKPSSKPRMAPVLSAAPISSNSLLRSPQPPRHRSERDERRRAVLEGPDADIKSQSRRVSMLVYLAVCQLGVMLGTFVWSWFLVLQGRYCTGADGDATGAHVPVVSNEPSDSLILRPIPGCAFGSAWQDDDFEGQALRHVWSSMAAQVLAMLLLVADQGMALGHACCMRCNFIARRQRYKRDNNSSDRVGKFLCCSTAAWSALVDSRTIFVPDAWMRACKTRVWFLAARPQDADESTGLTARAVQPRTVVEVACGCCAIVANGPDNVEDWLDGTSENVHADTQ